MVIRSEIKLRTTGSILVRYRGRSEIKGKTLHSYSIYYDNKDDTVDITSVLTRHEIIPSPMIDLYKTDAFCIRFRIEE